MRAGPGRGQRAADSLRQLAEYLLAVILIISALHAPKSGLLLLVGAVLVGGWAAVHDSPLAAIRAVGGTMHRVGLIALAVGLAATVPLTGRFTDPLFAAPILFVAVLLLRLAIPRRRQASPQTGQTNTPPSPARLPPAQAREAAGPDQASIPLARVTGIAAARAGNLLSTQVDRAVPAGARHAGRLVGRLTQRRPKS